MPGGKRSFGHEYFNCKRQRSYPLGLTLGFALKIFHVFSRSILSQKTGWD